DKSSDSEGRDGQRREKTGTRVLLEASADENDIKLDDDEEHDTAEPHPSRIPECSAVLRRRSCGCHHASGSLFARRSTLREVRPNSPTPVSSVRTRDGLDLRTYRWPAVGTARAHVLLVHGIAEHAGRYPRVVSQLPGARIAIHSYDQRGFGRSGGHRAYVDRWSQYHDDVEDRLAEVRSAADGLPVVLYGHSMGGLIALGYVLSDPPRPLPDLLVLSAPAIDAVVPSWKRGLADILAGALPRFAVANTFANGALASDPAVETAYRADPLAVHRTTTRLGVSLFREQDRVKSALANGAALPVATYVLHGTDDPIVPE